MTKEIKEILLDNSRLADIGYHKCKEEDLSFSNKDYRANLLLDYITNLQQENEKLKERIDYLERSNNRREDTIQSLRFEIAEQGDYKSRIDKAIEYIEEHTEKINKRFTIPKIDFNYNDLLNILKGEDNEC